MIISAASASVNPATATATPQPGASGQTFAFTVTNNGVATTSYTLSAVCAGAGVQPSPCGVSPTTLSNVGVSGAPTATVSYTAGAAGTTGTVTLQAKFGATVLATGVLTVNVASSTTVVVTPDGGAPLVRPPSTASQQTFQVKQTTGVIPAIYNVSAACTTPAATGCPTSLSPVNVTALNTDFPVVVNFTSGAGGAPTGRVTLTATHSSLPTATDNGFLDVRVVNATSVPTVTNRTVLGNQTNQTLTYTVTNTGPVVATFDLLGVCAGTPALSGCQASSTQLVNFGVNSQTTVTVSYNTGAPIATGTVSLQVRFAGVTVATGSTTVTVASNVPQAPTISTTRWNPGPAVPREECVTISLGSTAAAECGALRLVHQVPALRTMNKDRAPTLLYSSVQAEPSPQVGVMVTMPPGTTIPDTVRAVLKLAGAVRGQGRWLGSQWTAGVPRLVRVRDTLTPPATGISSYTVEVTNIYNSPAAQLTSTVSQGVAVVNRQASAFGRGWWLAGVELLNTSTFVWVGGDGSVRQYQSAGTDKWVALPAVDYPDTLKKTSASPVEYTRFLRGGLKVVFDAQGRHVRTVNRVGHTTRFWYNASGRLDSIVLPVRGSAPTHGRRFAFTYPTNQVLIADGQSRTTTVTLTGGTVNRVTSIGGPDAFNVSFGYPAASSGLVTSRTDRVNAVRRFVFDSLRHVTRAALFPGPPYGVADSVIASVQPAESRGAPGTTSVDTANVTTVYDGPRPPADAADVTTFWTNVYGAPWKILDPGNGTTLIERTSSAYVGFVTRVTTAGGRVLVATPDSRGRVGNVIDQTVTATPTAYLWEDGFDQLTRISPPEGDSTVFEVQPGTGNRIGQSDARGATSKIVFGYDLGQLTAVTYPGTSAIQYTYDNQGNLDSTITALGYRSKRANDAIGRPQTITTQLNVSAPLQFTTETRTYTLWNQDSTAVTSALGESITVTTGHDAEGRVTLVRRTFTPDPKVIGAMSDGWSYDLAGRLRTKTTAAGGTEAYTLDQAGNVKSVLNPRSYTINLGYDALNRLTSRSYPAAPGAPHTTTIVTTFPANVPYGDTVPAGSESFLYSADGVLRFAANCDAEVVRSIHTSGRIDNETLKIRTVNGPCGDWQGHVFTTSYGYDRNNRRIKTTVPALFAATTPGDSIKFGYDAAIGGGRLTSVRDLMGNSVSMGYKPSGELERVTYPGNVVRQMGFDHDGQLTSDGIATGAAGFPRFPAGVMRQTTFGYDARGKLLTAADPTGFQERATALYSGLGYLDNSWLHQSYVDLAGYPTGFSTGETFGHDALGNETTRTSADTVANATGSNATSSSTTNLVYAAGTGRLTQRPPRSYSYDAAGNLEWEVHTGIFERAHYYSADGRLRTADYREIGGSLFGGGAVRQRTLERYRYDALGRRVWVWTQVQCMINSGFECTRDRVRRTIWDGNQELVEIQVPGDTANQTKWEIDAGGYNLNRISNGILNFDPNPYYGQVVYSGALGVDQPLSVTRIGYADKPTTTYTQWAPFAFYPHWNYRGQAVFGSFGDGGAVKQFVTGAGGITCPELASTSNQRCALFNWPAGSSAYDRKKGTPAMLGWQGTLIDNKRDGSGLDFKRNRVVDPVTGRFTQEDPIALAGGVNGYGFAKGDPINYTDPFGLCPPEDNIDGPHCSALARRVVPGLSSLVNRGLCTADQVSAVSRDWRVYARALFEVLAEIFDDTQVPDDEKNPDKHKPPPPAPTEPPPPKPDPQPGDVVVGPDGGVIVTAPAPSPEPAPGPAPGPSAPPSATGRCQGVLSR